MVEYLARSILGRVQGPGTCTVHLGQHAQDCVLWLSFRLLVHSKRQLKNLKQSSSPSPDMSSEDPPTLPDPPRDPPAEVSLTRADIPELIKAVVAAVEKTAGTSKPPGKWSLTAR